MANKHQNIVKVCVTQKILAERLQMDLVKPLFKYLNKKKIPKKKNNSLTI